MRFNVAISALVVIIVSLFAAGCKSHSSTDSPQQGLFPAIEGANLLRLTPTGDANLKSVRGTIKIVGLTVADDQGLAVPADKSALEVMARLLDPGDDILSEIIPGTDGRFTLQTTEDTISAKLAVDFKVEEDIDGNGEGGDRVFIATPIALVAGYEVLVDITINLGNESDFDQVLTGSTPDPQGELLLVEYSSNDGNGEHKEFYGLFPESGLVVYDKDGDEFLEPGDDLSGTDSDTNGWIDQEETVFADPVASPSFVEGTVTGVSIADREMTLKTSDSQEYLVLVATFTSIEIIENGEFIGLTSLGDHLVGKSAHVDGFLVSGFTMEASWIVINEQK